MTSSRSRHPVLECLPRRITFRRHAYRYRLLPCQGRANPFICSTFPVSTRLDPAPSALQDAKLPYRQRPVVLTRIRSKRKMKDAWNQ